MSCTEKLENVPNLECLQNPSTGRELIRLIILDYITLVRDFLSLDWLSGKTIWNLRKIRAKESTGFKEILDFKRKILYSADFVTFIEIAVKEESLNFLLSFLWQAFRGPIPYFLHYLRCLSVLLKSLTQAPLTFPSLELHLRPRYGNGNIPEAHLQIPAWKARNLPSLLHLQTTFPGECRLSG